MHNGFDMLTQVEARGTEPPGLVPGGLVYGEGDAHAGLLTLAGPPCSTPVASVLVFTCTHRCGLQR